MDILKPFDNRLAGLITSLSPAGRRQLATTIAKQLRTNQQQRIKRQQAPDGKPYVPRKTQKLRLKKGRIKREMFTKLRTNRFLKANGDTSEAIVQFADRVQRMARVHHYGLRDRPSSRSKEVQYGARPLLGLTRSDWNIIEKVTISYYSCNNNDKK